MRRKLAFCLLALSVFAMPFYLFSNENTSQKQIEEAIPPFDMGGESYGLAIFKTVGSLALLLLLVFLTIWALRKATHGRLPYSSHSSGIKVLERRSLSPKSILYLVEVGEKRMVIGESQCQLSFLAQLRDKKEKDL